METSKKILGGSWFTFVALTAICIVGSFEGYDMENVTALAQLSCGELTAAHCFYYWKAKNENRAKGVQSLVKDMAKEYGVDSATRFAEIVFKD